MKNNSDLRYSAVCGWQLLGGVRWGSVVVGGVLWMAISVGAIGREAWTDAIAPDRVLLRLRPEEIAETAEFGRRIRTLDIRRLCAKGGKISFEKKEEAAKNDGYEHDHAPDSHEHISDGHMASAFAPVVGGLRALLRA
jgi:hypothetical protein